MLTFAAKVIKEVEGHSHKVSENTIKEFIKKEFTPKNLSEENKQLLCKYVLYGGDHLRSEGAFHSYSEYQNHLCRHLKTPLCGKAVANFGSYFIANFLTIHGIDYSYYKKTDNFLIKGTNIFIQYHPFHANGNWPSCFSENYQTLPCFLSDASKRIGEGLQRTAYTSSRTQMGISPTVSELICVLSS